MSNFSFISSTEWEELAQVPQEAEQNVHSAPLYCAMLCRKSLEEWVRWMYEHDEDLELPYDTSLNSLMHNQSFKDIVAPSQFQQINLIRKLGNSAVHTTAKIKTQEALHGLQLLHGFIRWVMLIYSEVRVPSVPFDENLVPKAENKEKTKEELQKLEKAFTDQQDELKKVLEELKEIKARKDKNVTVVLPPMDPNEDLTRKTYIDTLLREAGWDPYGFNVPEYPVKDCMPTGDGANNGPGRVDYVLWGDDGKPLALVEAKKTSRDSRVGQHQAKCYADCLQKEFGQRPIIFYSNGFNTYIWDDLNYAPREVQGFYTKDELTTLIHRRTYRKNLSDQTINASITDRYYQHEAIRSFAEKLELKHREGLMIMATGTGKTRVAASVIDFLSKAGWVKRVLFLADRNALIHQAKTSLNDCLPNLPAVDLTKDKENDSSRIVFCTYQTMINMIDGEVDGENRFYGVGHFDLIIFDEIHRSVYNRYRAIFNYFDGLRLGLTATPRSETDRDTYGLFHMEPGVPTYAYELDQAVGDGFLVAPKAISVPLKFHREGIKYSLLSEEEKQKYEEEFADPLTGEFPDEIDSAALNKWLFNTDTVDKVLAHLMEHGIKVEGGDKLAKTMIFARSHKHAMFIQERFNKQFPEYSGDFLSVIDYQQEYKYDLLAKFKTKTKLPQIAVSVDMLDTGIDVPEVCNLLFFKPIRSRTKFFQMIGRGTRLCKDLFGPGIDKSQFVIFDFCQNFEYFDENPKGLEGKQAKGLSQRLFEIRLKLAQILRYQDDQELKAFAEELIHFLVHQTQQLNIFSFLVRAHQQVVEKFKDPHVWNVLSELEIKELITTIAPLVSESSEDELAKRFDLLMYDIQNLTLEGNTRQMVLISKVRATAGQLSKKASVPSVGQKLNLLRDIQQPEYWAGITVLGIENLRKELRDIIKFLDFTVTPIVYTDFEDAITGVGEERSVYQAQDLDTYRRRVADYLRQQSNLMVIQKLHRNIPITAGELEELERLLFEQGAVSTKQELQSALGNKPLGAFVRSIIGMEVSAAKEAFSSILENKTLNSQQIRFLDQIIDFFAHEGYIEPSRLFESPFTDIIVGGISGAFDQDTSMQIIQMIVGVNENAVAFA